MLQSSQKGEKRETNGARKSGAALSGPPRLVFRVFWSAVYLSTVTRATSCPSTEETRK